MRNLLQVANFTGQLIDSIISYINLAQASVLRRREVGAVELRKILKSHV